MSEAILAEMFGKEVLALSRPWAIAEEIGSINLLAVGPIKGDVIGLGLQLSVACDFQIAAQNTKIRAPKIKLGVLPGAGGTRRLAKIIGMTLNYTLDSGGK